MKLLINICAQDGIISHNSGVGTMVKRYVSSIENYCDNNGVILKLNLFTPEYFSNSFGYSKETEEELLKMKNVSIYRISNGSDGHKFFGNSFNWKKLSSNTIRIINKTDFKDYDYVITLLNDTPFGGVIKSKNTKNHIKVWIPHSTGKIHMYGLKSILSKSKYERIKYEKDIIEYINKTGNSYVGVIGEFISDHLMKKYGLKKEKSVELFNGEILREETKYYENNRCEELFEKIKNEKEIILSFGRPEKYKNLHSVIKLSKYFNFKTIVITQEYFKGMKYIKKLKKISSNYNTLLYINEPFNYPQYIINHFKGNIILIVPSKKEIAGLIVNEIRKFNKDNILLIANNINGIKEQINDGIDGTLINLNNIKRSVYKIKKCYNKKYINKVVKGSYKRLTEDYDFDKNMSSFIDILIGR